jgi:hypothetical protein
MEVLSKHLKQLPLKLLPEWLSKLQSAPQDFYPLFLSTPLMTTSYAVLQSSHTSRDVKVQELKENLLLEIQAVKNIAVSQHRGGSDRTLAFVLTDGHSIIRAFEFEEVQELKETTKAGSKVLLLAPLTVRRGVIVLCPGNIMVLSEVLE